MRGCTNALRYTMRQQTGAALVAVLLLTMVLSAIGVLAINNTFRSMQLAGNYRLRTQAQDTSEAALTFLSVRAGDKQSTYMGILDASCENEAREGADRQRLIERGCAQVWSNADFQSQSSNLTGTSGETGLFSDGAELSHESDPSQGTVDFDVIIRDPGQGPPPVGSDNSFCTRKIFMASRSSYGDTNAVTDWDSPGSSANSMVGLEAWIGPIPCNGGGSN